MAETTAAQANIKTRFLIISDTHGLGRLPGSIKRQHADVAMHCGDLTTGSKLEEFKASLRLLQAVDAPLKLVIAGNHDFTMDIPVFERKVADACPPLDPMLIEQAYGYFGEARKLFGPETGINFLDEGTRIFRLENGAMLKVYASPYTPSGGDWGFRYHPDHGHIFSIPEVDIVMTHGPPRGILDYSRPREQGGCPFLFEAVARSRPRMHCFGHIHAGWGAKLVTWRQNLNGKPSHESDIDDEKSLLVNNLASIRQSGRLESLCAATSHCTGDPNHFREGSQTLFINAATQGADNFPFQPPWLVDLELPRAI